MRFTGISLILTTCLLLLVSCGSSDLEADLIGEWAGQVVKQDLVFHADGTVEMQGHEHSTYYGTYVLDTDGNLTCTFANLSDPVKCRAEISGDRLKLTFPSREEIYIRK